MGGWFVFVCTLGGGVQEIVIDGPYAVVAMAMHQPGPNAQATHQPGPQAHASK